VYKLSWIPDSCNLVGVKAADNIFVSYALNNTNESIFTYSKSVFSLDHCDKHDLISFQIASDNRFMITANNKTDVIVWDLDGNKLDQIDTQTMSNYCVRISPCSRFIGACGKFL
jgi:myo-inositol-hexaphosphate 3-phosphohydrolase